MRTRNSLRHKASKALCLRLFLVLSSIPYQKIMGSQSAWAGVSVNFKKNNQKTRGFYAFFLKNVDDI